MTYEMYLVTLVVIFPYKAKNGLRNEYCNFGDNDSFVSISISSIIFISQISENPVIYLMLIPLC